jgi:hypothetical protein
MNRLFETANPDLAAYLYACAYRIVKVNRAEGQVVFSFPPEAALSAEAFYAGAAISAKNLLYAVHRLEALRRTYQHEYIAA